MARPRVGDLHAWAAAAAQAHPRDLSAHLAATRGVSRSTARRLLRALVDAGWLVREGRPCHPVYRPGVMREVTRSYVLAGLDEQTPWERDFAPCFDLRPNVREIVHHAFTELVNNSIDHSGGDRVTVSMRQNRTHLHLLVGDDGCGVFERISQAFALHDPRLALLELSKGKLTTQPGRHAGRGLYFCSRLFDVFDLHANGICYQHSLWQRRDWLSANPLHRPGTTLFMSIPLDSSRTLQEVFAAHAGHDGGMGFARTVVPLRLARFGEELLVSRAQARRVAARLEQFEEVALDFDDVPAIGHAFADELFRVFAHRHPGVVLQACNMNDSVARVVQEARRERSLQPVA